MIKENLELITVSGVVFIAIIALKKWLENAEAGVGNPKTIGK